MRKLILIFICLLIVIPCQARTITVNWDGSGDYLTIQAAVNDSNDGDIVEIQPGIYTGDGNRDIDFGGRAITVRSTDPNNPGIVAATIIDCNGTEEEPHRGFYFHNNENSNSVLDGLTITNGYASGSYLEEKGGAILCENSSPTIANCAIISNTAYWSGGGICFYKCYGRIPNIVSCTFFDNWAGFNGGGMASYDSSPILNNCTFSGNFAGGIGGGIAHTDFGGPTLTKCRLIGNTAAYVGGGMYGCSGPITNCTITGNWAGESGGGMDTCWGPITNCIITGNLAGYWGGGMHQCSGPITNCTITGNWAGDQGGGLAVCYGPITNCTITDNWVQNHGGGLAYCGHSFTNCIIWGNSNEQIYKPLNFSITYSDIQGGWPGLGNIDADPCFVDPGYWDPNGTPADANDDFWVEGDYHLKSEGWRWVEPEGNWTWNNVTSRCIDAGNPGSILGDEPLAVPRDPNNVYGKNLRINMGAYGGTAEASMPPHDWAILGDLTNDGTADWQDFAYIATEWLATADEQPGDLDRNGVVGWADLALFVDDWLKQTTWYG